MPSPLATSTNDLRLRRLGPMGTTRQEILFWDFVSEIHWYGELDAHHALGPLGGYSGYLPGLRGTLSHNEWLRQLKSYSFLRTHLEASRRSGSTW